MSTSVIEHEMRLYLTDLFLALFHLFPGQKRLQREHYDPLLERNTHLLAHGPTPAAAAMLPVHGA